jgi:hypothetical protein
VSAMATSSSSSPSRCAVVGVGVLGTSLCQQILSATDFADATVTGITKTTNNHESIRDQVGAAYSDRLHLVTSDEAGNRGEKFRDVVFCAPPSGFEDYAAAVADAVENIWAGPEAGGVFVFTSSGGVYVYIYMRSINSLCFYLRERLKWLTLYVFNCFLLLTTAMAQEIVVPLQNLRRYPFRTGVLAPNDWPKPKTHACKRAAALCVWPVSTT